MRKRGLRRALVIGCLCLLVAVAVLALLGWRWVQGPGIDPLIAGRAKVTVFDLPAEWQTLSQDDLRAKLRVGLEQNRTETEDWRLRLKGQEGEDLRLLALYLGDRRAAVRCLYGLARGVTYDDAGMTIDYLDIAVDEARRGGFVEEEAECRLLRVEPCRDADLLYRAVDEAAEAARLFRGLHATAREERCLFQEITTSFHWLGRYDEALALWPTWIELEKAKDKTFHSAQASLMLWIMALQDCGRLEEALAKARETLALADQPGADMDRPEILRQIGVICTSMGRYPEAEEALLAAAREPPTSSIGRDVLDPQLSLLRLYRATGEAEKARLLCKVSVAELDMKLAAMPKRRGGETGQVRDDLLELKAELLAALGDVELAQRDFAGAAGSYERARQAGTGLELWPARRRVAGSLGNAYVELGRTGDALAVLEGALAEARQSEWRIITGPDDPSVLVAIGCAHTARGEYSPARRALKRALRNSAVFTGVSRATSEADALEALGDLDHRQGRDAAAASSYRKAFDRRASVVQALVWNAPLIVGSCDKARECGDTLAGLFTKGGRVAEAAEVEGVCDQTESAAALALGKTLVRTEAGRQALADYRRATTYCETLRWMLEWSSGHVSDASVAWMAVQRETPSGRKYILPLLRERARLRKELGARIAAQEAAAAKALAELRRAEPEITDIIELRPASQPQSSSTGQ